MAKHLAIAAAISLLQQVTPPTYHHDLATGLRVYPTMLMPTHLPFQPLAGEHWAYCCLPLVETNGSYVDQGTMELDRWTMRVYGFVGEQDQSRESTTAVADISKLESDILRVFRLYPTLGGAVFNSRPVSSDPFGGWPQDEGRRYGSCMVAVEVDQLADETALRPS